VPKPAVPATVRITFESTPSGAKVSRPDGELLGTTPFTKTFDKGSPAMDVAFSLPGHTRQTRSIETATNHLIDVTLAREAATAPVAVADPDPPTSARPKKPSSSPKSKPASKSKPAAKNGEDPGGLIKTIFDK
jgi:hypothetical protein